MIAHGGNTTGLSARRLARYQALGAGLVVAVLLVCGRAEGGSVHIKWGPDAPERLAQPNLDFYEDLVALRASHPRVFDHNHPFYGRLLTDTTFMESLERRWEANKQRFEYWHPDLWRMLDGYVVWSKIHPPPVLVLNPPPSTPVLGGQELGNPPAGSGNGTNTSVGVPEPPTALLMLTSMILVFMIARCRSQVE